MQAADRSPDHARISCAALDLTFASPTRGRQVANVKSAPLSSDERESQEAGAEQGDPTSSQGKEPIGNEISISHDTPSASDALSTDWYATPNETMLPVEHSHNLSVLVPGPVPWYGSSA